MGRVKPDDLTSGVKGVEIHGKKIRICFTYKKQRCREVLDIPVTKQNIKFAEKKLNAIKYEIAAGKFSYSEHFPNSKRLFAFGEANKYVTMSRAVDIYWPIKKTKIGLSSQRTHINAIRQAVNIIDGRRLLVTLKPMEVEGLRKKLMEDYKPSTANYYYVCFCDFIKWCEANKMTDPDINFSDHIKKIPIGKGNADPFSSEELSAIISACVHPQHRHMILVSVYTGIRVGELRALCWEDVDFDRRQLHIRRNVIDLIGGERSFKLPKTGFARTVDLQPPAFDALVAQMKYTYQHPPTTITVDADGVPVVMAARPVFSPLVSAINKTSRAGLFFSQPAITSMWSKLTKKSGVRHRHYYQLRHTYASWNLTAHGNLAYIANQMGHTSYKMLQQVYGKWIHSASKSEAEVIWEKMKNHTLFAPVVPQGSDSEPQGDDK